MLLNNRVFSKIFDHLSFYVKYKTYDLYQLEINKIYYTVLQDFQMVKNVIKKE